MFDPKLSQRFQKHSDCSILQFDMPFAPNKEKLGILQTMIRETLAGYKTPLTFQQRRQIIQQIEDEYQKLGCCEKYREKKSVLHQIIRELEGK